MRRRLILVSTLAALLVAAVAAPASAAREFGTIYAEDTLYRTFGNPARVDPGTGTDPIAAFTNFEQPGVARHGPGPGSHGGRWAVYLATWADPTEAHLLTNWNDIIALVDSGAISLERTPEADFRCPILPNVR